MTVLPPGDFVLPVQETPMHTDGLGRIGQLHVFAGLPFKQAASDKREFQHGGLLAADAAMAGVMFSDLRNR
jgi:hypothetical protein